VGLDRQQEVAVEERQGAEHNPGQVRARHTTREREKSSSKL